MSDPQIVEATFLFTDIEGSTRLWERYPEAMQTALSRHDAILRRAIETCGGHIFKTLGDAFYAVFDHAPDALCAALSAQRALSEELWGETGPLRVRMALHTGVAMDREGDYFGLDLSRVARLLYAGHGGQILLSASTQEEVRGHLPSGAELRDLGERRLKDLVYLERIFQFVAPGLPAEFPPLRTLDARPGNLPAQPTLLVGRDRELAEVCALLRRAGVRLLTLSGPGGTGKTRLGLQVAADLLDDFVDGVFFVALASISDPALVVSAVAQTLGVKEGAGRSLEEGLAEFLSDKEVLLLLDNFEQVVAAAPLVSKLLEVASGLKVLVTSREVLRVYGEHEYPVPPLALPDLRRLPPIEELAQYPAVALFVERTQAVRPSFVLREEDGPAVAEICVRLDGLPLAIELAAARSKLLPPQAMLARLSGVHGQTLLGLLTGGPRDLPARQQTLRGAIDWSYDLLEPGEKSLFARLAVFVGGATLAAIEAVASREGDLPIAVFDGLASLVDKSMLRQEQGVGGEPRFRMLETIREYAAERLEREGEAEALRQWHAEYFLALAERAEPKLVGPEQVLWLDRLEEEHDNLRAVLGWAFKRGELEMTLRLGGALGRFWYTRSHFAEGRRWLEPALERGRGLPPAIRAKALSEAGLLAYDQADYGCAQVYFEESLALRQELEDRPGIASSLNRLGILAMYQQDQERAKAYFEGSRALWEELGYRKGAASCTHNLGIVAKYLGDYERAVDLHEQSLALYREMGDRHGTISALILLGSDTLYLGDAARAVSLCREALRLLRELADKRLIIEGLEALARALVEQGQARRAARLCGAAESLREALGVPLPPVDQPFYERIVASARARLEEDLFAAAWAEGQAMTPEQALAYALEEEVEA